MLCTSRLATGDNRKKGQGLPAAILIQGPAWVGRASASVPQYSATFLAVSGLPASSHLAWMPFTWAAPTTPTTPCPSALFPASHIRLQTNRCTVLMTGALAYPSSLLNCLGCHFITDVQSDKHTPGCNRAIPRVDWRTKSYATMCWEQTACSL